MFSIEDVGLTAAVKTKLRGAPTTVTATMSLPGGANIPYYMRASTIRLYCWVTCLLFVIETGAARADAFILKDGSCVVGEINARTKSNLFVRLPNGKTRNIPLDSLDRQIEGTSAACPQSEHSEPVVPSAAPISAPQNTPVEPDKVSVDAAGSMEASAAQPSDDIKKLSNGKQGQPISISLKGNLLLKENSISMSARLQCQLIAERNMILIFRPDSEALPQFAMLSAYPRLQPTPLIFERPATDAKRYFKGYQDLKARTEGTESKRATSPDELSRELKKSWTAVSANLLSKESLKDLTIDISYDANTFHRFTLRRPVVKIAGFTDIECSFICELSLTGADEAEDAIRDVPTELRTKWQFIENLPATLNPLVLGTWSGSATAVALSPDESLVAIGLTDKRTMVRLYSVPRFDVQAEFDLGPPKTSTTSLTFDDAATHIVATYGSVLHFLNIKDKESSYVLTPKMDTDARPVKDRFQRVFFTPNNGLVAIGSEGAVSIAKALQKNSSATAFSLFDQQLLELQKYFSFATDWGSKKSRIEGSPETFQVPIDERNRIGFVIVDKAFKIVSIYIEARSKHRSSETLSVRREPFLGKAADILIVPGTNGALVFPEDTLRVNTARLPIQFVPIHDWYESEKSDARAWDAGFSIQPNPYLSLHFDDTSFSRTFKKGAEVFTVVPRKEFEYLLHNGRAVLVSHRLVLSHEGANLYAEGAHPGVFENWNLSTFEKDPGKSFVLPESLATAEGLAFVSNQCLLTSSVESPSGFPVLSLLELQTGKIRQQTVFETGELHMRWRGRLLLLFDQVGGHVRLYDWERLRKHLSSEE